MVEDLDAAIYIRVRVEKAKVLYRLFRKIDDALGKIMVSFDAALRVKYRSVQPDADLSHRLACDSFRPEEKPT